MGKCSRSALGLYRRSLARSLSLVYVVQTSCFLNKRLVIGAASLSPSELMGHRTAPVLVRPAGREATLAGLVAVALFSVHWSLIVMAVPASAATAAERAALVDLYNATDGVNWQHNTSWLSGDPCTPAWYGVDCAGEGGVVYVLLAASTQTPSIGSTTSVRRANKQAVYLWPFLIGVMS